MSGCFPGSTNGEEPSCQCRRHKTHGSHPWVRKIPWRRAWQPTPALDSMPWTEEPGRLQSIRSQRIRLKLLSLCARMHAHTHTHTHTRTRAHTHTHTHKQGRPENFITSRLGKISQGKVENGSEKGSRTELCLVAQLCPTPCDPMDSRPPCPWGFSRQEYWSGLPCPPPEGHNYTELFKDRGDE